MCKWHRFMGWFVAALGVTIPVLGVSTAITMAHFNMHYLHSEDEASGLMVSFLDMAAFAVPFTLAICWRAKPEFHRRLILIASCALTSAAFARFPPSVLPQSWFYLDVDILILLGAIRDLARLRRVHPVYLFALPALVMGQTVVMHTADSSAWLRIGNAILQK